MSPSNDRNSCAWRRPAVPAWALFCALLPALAGGAAGATFPESSAAGSGGEAAVPEEGSASRVSLEEAIQSALAGNPDLAALRADAGASEAARRVAEAGRWPGIYTSAGLRRSNNQVVVFSDKLTAGEFTAADFNVDTLNHPGAISHGVVAVGVEVPIDVAGRVGAGIGAARDTEAAAGSGLTAAEIDLVARVIEAYDAVGLADATARVAEQALENARRSEAVAEARAGSGAALRSEALRARAARLGRERELDRHRADAALARSTLGVLIGRGGAILGPLDPVPVESGELGPLESWTAGAAAARADVGSARLGADAATAAAAQARAARGPEMGATARYELNASGFDAGEGSYLVGLAVRWGAWDGGRAPRIAEAEARAAAAAARIRSLEDRVGLEVERAWRDAQVADRGLDVTRESAAANEEARRISAERYAAGLLPLTDLLATEDAAVAARLGELSARHDALVARLRLKQAAGRLVVPR
jgi:outer membrane protein